MVLIIKMIGILAKLSKTTFISILLAFWKDGGRDGHEARVR